MWISATVSTNQYLYKGNKYNFFFIYKFVAILFLFVFTSLGVSMHKLFFLKEI